MKKEIKSEINSLNANYKELFKSKLSNIINSIIDKLCKINNKNSLITVSLTHGDFHEGNILYNEKKGEIILIDWEYSSIRCIWYDAFFNELKCSSPKGLAKRIKLFENKSYGEELFWFLDGIKLDLELSQKTFLYIFILELLLSRLQQSNISKELIINQGLILYVQELSKLNFVNA